MFLGRRSTIILMFICHRRWIINRITRRRRLVDSSEEVERFVEGKVERTFDGWRGGVGGVGGGQDGFERMDYGKKEMISGMVKVSRE